MSSKANRVEAITKKEMIRRISQKTGFTQKNCTKAFDAVVEVFAEVILEGRAIPLVHFGRIEPFTKPARKMYYLDDKTGIRLDENGEKVSYMFPPTRWVKFHMTHGYKCKMNPGIYEDIPVNISDSD